MDAIFYVLAIMGCSDGSAQCTQTRVEPVRYATEQACEAAMPRALARNSDLSYPVITAACRSTATLAADRNPPRESARRG